MNAIELESIPFDHSGICVINISMTGLEPATPRLEVWCAIQLRHTDKKVSPGFEPGSVGSKPKVLTITPRNQMHGEGFEPSKRYAYELESYPFDQTWVSMLIPI